jgi:hypothetical protein
MFMTDSDGPQDRQSRTPQKKPSAITLWEAAFGLEVGLSRYGVAKR